MKLRLNHLAFALLALALAAGVYIAFFAYPALQKKRAELDAVEAYFVSDCEETIQWDRTRRHRPILYLSVLGEDPPEEFLLRFRDHRICFRKGSDRKPGEAAIDIGRIDWNGENEIHMDIIWTPGDMTLITDSEGLGCTIFAKVRKSGTRWKLVSTN